MISLVTATRDTRLFMKFGGITLTVLFLLFFSFKGYGIIKNMLFPPPPAPPEIGYGPLPTISFPASIASSPQEYRINTIDGQLPLDIPDRLNVYVIATPAASLIALDRTKYKVNQIGYNPNEFKISDTVYQWAERQNNGTIEIDILSNNFKIESNFIPFLSTVDNEKLLNEETVKEDVNQLLSSLEVDTSDLDMDKTQFVYLQYDGQKLVEAEKKSDSQTVRVNLYQKNLGEITIGGKKRSLDIFYPYPDRTLLTFLLVPGERNSKVVQAEFIHRVVLDKNFSSYPIKTPQESYDELKNGNSYIVVNNSPSPVVDITEVLLGYFVNASSDFRNNLAADQKFLMPIYIFKGNGFMAYVSAVAASAVSN